MLIEMANLAGLTQAGIPVMMRGSTAMPSRAASSTTSITSPPSASGQLRANPLCSSASSCLPRPATPDEDERDNLETSFLSYRLLKPAQPRALPKEPSLRKKHLLATHFREGVASVLGRRLGTELESWPRASSG